MSGKNSRACVGLKSDGSIELAISDAGGPVGRTAHSLDLDEADFLVEELKSALARARLKKGLLTKVSRKPAAEKPHRSNQGESV
ncbi:MAG: hypothetical protein BWY99_02233 [Synergistetes bacterium ADurb.BinA166]|nr:MAG: hypothetical protein BWY99_02233 [Synergistetes bacterium ADurb.BinA166]